MKNVKNIVVLTGGGLAPALNATLYGVIKAARQKGFKIYGSLYGWASLVQHGKIIDLTKLNIEAIKNRGGTFLRSSRTNPFKVTGGLINLRDNLKKYKIDAIIAIGGDDTLGAAAKLYQKEKIKVIGLPKTVDNDLPATYFCPGFPSAAYYMATLSAETREDSAYALSRVYIIESYGAQSGWLTCAASLGGADLVIPPEWQFDLEKILALIKKRYTKNGNFCLISLSKEAKIKGLKGFEDTQPDGYGHVRQEFISLGLKRAIEERLGLATKIILPMNYFQSGLPIDLDRKMGYQLGQKSIELASQGKFGRSVMVDLKSGKFIPKEVPINAFLKGTKRMPAGWFDKNAMQPNGKYLNYLKTLVGGFDFLDREYNRLQKQVNK